MTVCKCDYYNEPEGMYLTKTMTARQEHICCECGHTIKSGETFEQITGRWYDRYQTYKTCERCVDLRDTIAELTGGCWTFTELFETYFEVLTDGLEKLTDEEHDKRSDEASDQMEKILKKHKYWDEKREAKDGD